MRNEVRKMFEEKSNFKGMKKYQKKDFFWRMSMLTIASLPLKHLLSKKGDYYGKKSGRTILNTYLDKYILRQMLVPFGA